MRHVAGLSALLFLSLSGCAQIAQIPDDTLAKDLNVGAEKAVEYGLKFAMDKAPADALKIRDAAAIADTVLKQNIIPVFSGASTADVLKSAVDTALSQLSSKINNPAVMASIQLAIDILAANVPLPKNPADKIDDRTKKALNGIFSGMAAGIDAALAPPAAVNPTARQATGLHW
jgi:hypothetical protein